MPDRTLPGSAAERRLRQIDSLIREGRGAEARSLFLQASSRPFPRRLAATAGSLALRLGLYEKGLRILHPIVRPSPRRVIDATPAELAEYGHLLAKHGAPEEAAALLARVDTKAYPRALSYRATPLVAEWNYRDSIPLLTAYLRTGGLAPYDRLVAQVNLAAALVHERRLPKATALLRELLHTCSLRGHELALGRVLELSAELCLVRRDWSQAERLLDEAAKRLRHDAGIDAFIVDKFRALSDFLKRSGAGDTGAALAAVRVEALRRGHWETVRDCDRARAVVGKDTALLSHLWFGTPQARYRQKLVADFGDVGGSLPAEYLWNPFGSGTPTGTLDLLSGAADGKKTGLTPGSLGQRLLIALASDFYRPHRVAALHARLFPERPFDPTRSPALIHYTCFRLRRCLETHGIPLRIDECAGTYRLVGLAPYFLRLSAPEVLGFRHAEALRTLRAELHGPFSLGQALRVLGTPRRTTFRVLEEGCARGLLSRTGKTRAARYAFVG